MEKAAKLSPPWIIFYKELQAFFEKDPRIKMNFEEENYTIKIYVEGGIKAEALSELLPTEKTFGNVTVYINVIPANVEKEDKLELFKAAFEGNPVLSYVTSSEGIMAPDLKYVVFAKEVVQFFNDDLGDAHGVCSTLYQDIAKDIFNENLGVFYSTDLA